jgi:hypothetical protein
MHHLNGREDELVRAVIADRAWETLSIELDPRLCIEHMIEAIYRVGHEDASPELHR